VVTGTRQLWILLTIILLVRLVTTGLFPVIDTTEARYAEISRLMLTSGDWLVPQFREGIPFWGKPPLFAWMTAGSFKLLGVSEFSARLPHFVLGLATLLLVLRIGRFQMGANSPLLAVLILASTPLFFASSGTVMTESGLLFSTTLSMVGFWLCICGHSRLWGLMFFAGLGLGMLAKGPVALVMTGLPLVAWWMSKPQSQKHQDQKRQGQKHQIANLPWFSGLVLCLFIAVPWYLLAEQHSPGFLEYFFVGEHFLRFVQSGWQGDLYGNAHHEPFGMIWILWFQATAAWGLLFAFAALRNGRQFFGSADRSGPLFSDWQRYLLCWILTPLVFFTFSNNILWTYVITGLPAFALYLASSTEEFS